MREVEQLRNDPRSLTFSSCVHVVIRQSDRHPSRLSFFVLENLEGLRYRRKGDELSMAAEIQALFSEGLGSYWNIWAWEVQSDHVSLPQSCARVVLYGARCVRLMDQRDGRRAPWSMTRPSFVKNLSNSALPTAKINT